MDNVLPLKRRPYRLIREHEHFYLPVLLRSDVSLGALATALGAAGIVISNNKDTDALVIHRPKGP